MLSIDEGRFLVGLARKAIEFYFTHGRKMDVPGSYPEILGKKMGVFVTLSTYPDHRLRGCIGYPVAYQPLVEGTISAAVSAAFSDPRFMPLGKNEFNTVVVEVTVLTPMQLLSKDVPYEEQIKVGRDGLLVVCGATSGLLLPQVPVEWSWSEKEFLEQVCVKAGLPGDCYLDSSCEMYAFRGQIFEEESPGGDVKIKNITEV